MPCCGWCTGPIALSMVLAACGSGAMGGSSSGSARGAPQQSPQPASSPLSTGPSPVLTNVATFHGCPVFTAGDYYNAAVTTSAVDPDSAAYINAVWHSGDTAGFYASTGVEQTNLATDATPLVTIAPQVRFHAFPVPYPWQPNYYIEPLSDHHAMVVQTQRCHLYESYGTQYSGTKLTAYSGADWDMTKPFVPLPPGTPSSMASGLSLFAGMVKWEEYQAGSINHALNWAAIAHTVAQYRFVPPASSTDMLVFNGNLPQLPYGAHLRLKPSFSTAGWGPQSQMVARAMKTYGIYLADTGASGNALYFGNAPDGTNPWNAKDLAALSQVHVSDFEVLTLPPIRSVPGH